MKKILSAFDNAASGEKASPAASAKNDMKAILESFNRVESGVEECGMPMGSPTIPSSPPVTMSVNLNAQGVENIKELLNLMNKADASRISAPMALPIGGMEMPAAIHKAEPSDSVGGMAQIRDLISKADEEVPAEEGAMDGHFADATTAPDEEYADIDAVIPTGDDMHSKGDEAPKVNGGGNPMQETLRAQLDSLYKEIKESSDNVPPMPVRKNTSTHAMRDAWIAKYGKTHNANGTPKQPGMMPSDNQSAAEIGRLSDVAGMNAAGKRVPPIPHRKNTSTHGMRDAWLAKYGKTHNADGTPKS